jgi:large conductance mechanosensitive channel
MSAIASRSADRATRDIDRETDERRDHREGSNQVIKGFRDFIVRGNVIDLAVAIVIGLAFGAVVSAFASDVIGGLIGAAFSVPDFGRLSITLNDSRIVVGRTINAVIYFLLAVTVVYFAVVRPMNRRRERKRTLPPVDAPVRECPECLSAIPRAARRCAFCTSVVTPAD